jgi:hypothetical protein
VKHSRLEELRTRAKIRVKNAGKSGKALSLKQALEESARKRGYTDWRDLKRNLVWMDAVYPQGSSRMLNLWFSTPAEGRGYLRAKGGTLIPYGKQCFICDADYLAQLGFDRNDPDLKAVGPDWSEPAQATAWQRLEARLLKPRNGVKRGGTLAGQNASN